MDKTLEEEKKHSNELKAQHFSTLGENNPTGCKDFDLAYGLIYATIRNLSYGSLTGPYKLYFLERVLPTIGDPEKFFNELIQFASYE
jgi:hypothetical protein